MKKESNLGVGRPMGHALQHYKKIAKAMAKKINSGTWAAGFRLPSRAQLSATFRIGEGTIRRALNYLAQEKRITKTANQQWIVQSSEITFSLSARTIALLSTYHITTFWDQQDALLIRKSIEYGLAKHQKHLRLYDKRNYSIEMRRNIFPDIHKADLEGILLHGFFTKDCFKQYSLLNIPVVRVDASVPTGVQMASVCVDNVRAAKEAVLRIAQIGHRKIAFCRSIQVYISEVDPDSQERQEGFLAGLKECGIKNGKSDIFSFINDDNAATLRAILTAQPRYTAVLAVDGGIAEKIESAALKSGLILPRDLSIVAFSGLNDVSKYAGPRIDFEQLGFKAVEVLMSREVRQVRIPTSWHEGRTLVEVSPAKES